jgi:hypothetical protein
VLRRKEMKWQVNPAQEVSEELGTENEKGKKIRNKRKKNGKKKREK